MTADARWVAFSTEALNLGGSENADRIALHDRSTGVTSPLPAPEPVEGGRGTGECRFPRMADGGRHVVFVCRTYGWFGPDDDLGADQVFLRDLQSGRTELVTRGELDSTVPDVSADGRYVAFASDARLTAGGSPPGRDVFVHDRRRGTTRLLPRPRERSVGGVSISADGRRVAYTLLREVPRGREAVTIVRDLRRRRQWSVGRNVFVPGIASGGWDRTELSGNGRHVVFSRQLVPPRREASLDHPLAVFRHDLRTGRTFRIGDGVDASLSPDGRWVAWHRVLRDVPQVWAQRVAPRGRARLLASGAWAPSAANGGLVAYTGSASDGEQIYAARAR